MIPRGLPLRSPLLCRKTATLPSSLRPWRLTKRFESTGPRQQATSTSSPDIARAVTPSKNIFLRLGPLTRAVQAYGRAQKKRPYLVQVLSVIFIFGVADISAQIIGGKEYDVVRTSRSVFIGATFAVPQYKWFLWLSNNFNYSSRVLSMVTRVLVNQICFTPIFNVYFFGSQSLLSGNNIATTVERLTETLPRSWVNSWKLWPAVTFVAFSFIPLEYRSVFTGVIAIGWQTYLSFLNRQAEIRSEQEELASDAHHTTKKLQAA